MKKNLNLLLTKSEPSACLCERERERERESTVYKYILCMDILYACEIQQRETDSVFSQLTRS